MAGPLRHGGGTQQVLHQQELWVCPHSNKAWGTLLLGGIYVQVLDKHALFDPMLPLEVADCDSQSTTILGESFLKEVWASVLRQLMDQWKDGTVGTWESVYLAATPGAKATPMRSASKCGSVVSRLDMYRTKVLMSCMMVLLAHPTKVRC